MKLIVFMLLSLSLTQNFFTQTFTELNGFEDESGNTHLFYSTFCYYQSGGSSSVLYHWDINSNVDTIFYWGYFYPMPAESYDIVSYDFKSLNPDKYLYAYDHSYQGGGTFHYLCRNDYQFPTYTLWGDPIDNINISKLDTSFVVASALGVIRSNDGGFNWTEGADFMPIAMSPFNDSIIIGSLFFGPESIVKSTDRGDSFFIVDTTYKIQKAFFDQDHRHIYGIISNYDTLSVSGLLVSDNNGDPFTWVLKQEYTGRLLFSYDTQIPGSIFLANNKSLYHSTNYGNDFSLMYNFEEKIIGIYKKPGIDKIFIETPYYIFMLENGVLVTLKELPATEVKDKSIIPNGFSLLQNYPNPFNPSTTINYSIGDVGTSFMKFVQLKIYDILGNEVATLVNEEKPSGNYSVKFDGSKFASGIYFYQLKVGTFFHTRKMIFLK